MRKALVLAVLLITTTCLADSIQTFQIEGTLTSAQTGQMVGTFSGTLEINTGTGSIVNWNVAMPTIPTEPGQLGMQAYQFTPSDSSVWVTSSTSQTSITLLSVNHFFQLDVWFPNNTLIGFTGSAFIGNYGDPRSRNGASSWANGTIAPGIAPEPSSLLLVSSGLAGIVAFRRKLFGGTLQL